MPTKAKRACLEPGCLGYAERIGRCATHAAPILARRQQGKDRSGEAGRGLYFTRRWQALRAAILRAEPLCRACVLVGRVTAATDVDHVRAHRGDVRLFWAQQNLQPLCAACHHRKTAIERLERHRDRTQSTPPPDRP